MSGKGANSGVRPQTEERWPQAQQYCHTCMTSIFIRPGEKILFTTAVTVLSKLIGFIQLSFSPHCVSTCAHYACPRYLRRKGSSAHSSRRRSNLHARGRASRKRDGSQKFILPHRPRLAAWVSTSCLRARVIAT